MSAYDFYAEARSIADRIATDGFTDQAEEMRRAIYAGSSGTEIFMQLRFYLTPLEKDNGVSPATRLRIAILIDKIDEALNR